jgi:hypothetical protein
MRNGSSLDVGTILSIPCEVKDGAIPNEKFIRCEIGNITIEGAIPNDFTDIAKQSVIAVIYEVLANDLLSIYFNGDIFEPGNPITLPKSVVEKSTSVLSFDSK